MTTKDFEQLDNFELLNFINNSKTSIKQLKAGLTENSTISYLDLINNLGVAENVLRSRIKK